MRVVLDPDAARFGPEYGMAVPARRYRHCHTVYTQPVNVGVSRQSVGAYFR